MTRQTPDQFTVLIGHQWIGTGDPEALKAARSVIFGQLALLAAANQAADHTDLYYGAMWLEQFFPENTVFFFGVHETGTAIGSNEPVVASQSSRRWRIDTACPDGKPWTATFTAVGTGHQIPPARAEPATITMALRVDTIRALIMATVQAGTGDGTEFRHARRALLLMIRHELRVNPGADLADWMNWMPEMVFREYELLPSGF